MPFDPSIIIDKQFVTAFRGYDTVEVDEFLEELLQEFRAMSDELARSRHEVETLQEQIAMFQVMEDTMKSSLSSAQRTADKVLENAHREAELITRRAQLQADKEVSMALRESEKQLAANRREAENLVANARKEAEIAMQQADQAREKVAEYGARVRIALEAQMAILSGDKLFHVSSYALPSAADMPQDAPENADDRMNDPRAARNAQPQQGFDYRGGDYYEEGEEVVE